MNHMVKNQAQEFAKRTLLITDIEQLLIFEEQRRKIAMAGVEKAALIQRQLVEGYTSGYEAVDNFLRIYNPLNPHDEQHLRDLYHTYITPDLPLVSPSGNSKFYGNGGLGRK